MERGSVRRFAKEAAIGRIFGFQGWQGAGRAHLEFVVPGPLRLEWNSWLGRGTPLPESGTLMRFGTALPGIGRLEARGGRPASLSAIQLPFRNFPDCALPEFLRAAPCQNASGPAAASRVGLGRRGTLPQKFRVLPPELQKFLRVSKNAAKAERTRRLPRGLRCLDRAPIAPRPAITPVARPPRGRNRPAKMRARRERPTSPSFAVSEA